MMNSNMTCEAFDAALPGYIEGSLDGSLRTSIERHLRECLRCAALVRDIEKIRREAAALPDLVPSRDLWEGIEARIAAPVIPFEARPERQKRFAPAAWMRVAAAALVVSTAGVTYLLTARSMASAPSARVTAATQPVAGNGSPIGAGSSQTAGDAGAASSPGASVASRSEQSGAATERSGGPARLANQSEGAQNSHSDAVYGKEIEMLQKIVSERKTQLDPSTVAIIEKNLSIIDAAIGQSKAALAKDPASLLLSEQLTRALDKKVELLRTAALLPAST